MQMNKCICDQCNQTFRIDLKKHNHGKGIMESYFICSHCGYRYSAAVTNAEIRKRIKHFSTEWAKMSKLKNGKEWKKELWMKKYNRLQNYKAVTEEMIERLKKGLENGSLQTM